ncbi:hypothetical protein JYU34_020538 [Plutella xylostella]|uniref:Uncharacterized protein n=1 Tax=Plutella xylostella TaxID=51655 RepID=A0ABQ7PUN7_PLUXY|nr:hypothetical protein JYU34_020538 [Plutella xylostella]
MFEARWIFVQILLSSAYRPAYQLQLPESNLKDSGPLQIIKDRQTQDMDPLHGPSMVTMSVIKNKLRDTGVFDYKDESLTSVQKKEMSKMFDALEIMLTARNRQPSNVQNMFSNLRLVERVVKKQLKEGQISEALASKFKWDNLYFAPRRPKPYRWDAETKMRVFNLN